MHPRSLIIKKNILASILVKAGSVTISLLLVPLTIGYLNPVRYGIWITLSSILSWCNLFDIGLGNGLRNKFAEAVAKNDIKLAKIYVSTAYVILSFVALILFGLFVVISPALDWTKVLNAPPQMASELKVLVFWAVAFFLIKLVLALVNTVLMADQKSSLSDFLNFLSNLLTVVAIYVLTLKTSGSLLFLGICMSFVPVIVSAGANIFLYRNNYKDFAPSFKHVEMKYAKNLGNTGVQFFIIQIAVLVVFTTGNLIVTQLFGPAEVTPYNIAYKYFSVATLVFGMILTPFWTGFSDAYHRNDISWIKAVINKLIMAWCFLALIVVLMLAASSYVYKIWVGPDIKIPFTLSLVMAVSVLVMTWNNIFTYFINGVGKIRLQLYGAVLMSIVSIPLAVFFAKYLHLGSSGVMLATCVCMLSGSFLGPIQYRKIIDGTAAGIWAK